MLMRYSDKKWPKQYRVLDSLDALLGEHSPFNDFFDMFGKDNQFNVTYYRDTYPEDQHTTAKLDKKSNKYVLTFTVPGHSRQDLDVSYTRKNGALTVKSKAKDENNLNVFYSYTLPFDINEDTIKASCIDGLLTVTVEKLKETKDPNEVRTIVIN